MSANVSASGSMGSGFLEMIGDIKGAAKEAAAEVKGASTYTKQLEREAKQLERMLAKDERTLEKLRSKQGKAKSPEQQQQIQTQINEILSRKNSTTRDLDSRISQISDAQARELDLKSRQLSLKERSKDIADTKKDIGRDIGGRISSMNAVISSRLTSVQTSLQNASKALAGTNTAAGRAAASIVGRAAGSVGAAGALVAPVAIGAVAGLAIRGGIKGVQRVYDSRAEVARAQVQFETMRTQFANTVRDSSGGAELINQFNNIMSRSEKRIGDRYGLGSSIDEFLGTDFTGRRKEMLERQSFDARSIEAQAKLGETAATVVTGDNKDFMRQVNRAVERDLDRKTLLGLWQNFNQLSKETVGFSLGETIDDIAERKQKQMAQSWLESVERRIASNREQFERDPQRVSERHQQQTYFQVLFNDRLSRSMEWSAF